MTFDILIKNCTILTMSRRDEIIHGGIIGIKDGIIADVSTGGDIQSMDAGEVIDAEGSLVMPGLVNTHTHVPMVCFRGLADDLPLMEWLNNHIFPVERKFISRDMVYDGAMLAIAEMILSGTTTFCDGYFYESSVGRAAVDAGMRIVASQGFIDFPTPDGQDPSNNVRIAETFIEKWTDVSPLVTPSLVCHSAYTCSPRTLMAIKDVARRYGVAYQIHLAETREEAAMIERLYGETPVRHLDKLGVLDDATIPAHCVWVDDEEIGILADKGVRVSHNPESNMKLGAGVAPAPKMIDRGVVVGLGTDGAASNNDLDMFGEMATAAKLHKATLLDPTVMDARTVIRMATIEGARVLGLENRIGSIEKGKTADLIIIDVNRPHLTPLYNCYSHVVYAASGSDVRTSIIQGAIVMKDRILRTMNLSDVMDRVRKIADRVKAFSQGGAAS
ncbi:MAG: amidohydrolase [Deltaproteobacteria bacterium]|nr:amidohydrolase [Deltaproteobacteria bacterium]